VKSQGVGGDKEESCFLMNYALKICAELRAFIKKVCALKKD